MPFPIFSYTINSSLQNELSSFTVINCLSQLPFILQHLIKIGIVEKMPNGRYRLIENESTLKPVADARRPSCCDCGSSCTGACGYCPKRKSRAARNGGRKGGKGRGHVCGCAKAKNNRRKKS